MIQRGEPIKLRRRPISAPENWHHDEIRRHFSAVFKSCEHGFTITIIVSYFGYAGSAHVSALVTVPLARGVLS